MATKKKITKPKNKKESVKVITPPEPEIVVEDGQGPGRPLKFKNVEEIESLIQSYFDMCIPHVSERDVAIPIITETKGKGKNAKEVERGCNKWEIPTGTKIVKQKYITEQIPLTMTGLAYHLGTTREVIAYYAKKDEFFATIAKAKLFIHKFAEESLWKEKITAGIIFNLKNNWSWKDQTETLTKQAPTGKEHLSDEALDLEIELKNRENANKGK